MDFYNPLFARQQMIELACQHKNAKQKNSPAKIITVWVASDGAGYFVGEFVGLLANDTVLCLMPLNGQNEPMYFALDVITMVAPGDKG